MGSCLKHTIIYKRLIYMNIKTFLSCYKNVLMTQWYWKLKIEISLVFLRKLYPTRNPTTWTFDIFICSFRFKQRITRWTFEFG